MTYERFLGLVHPQDVPRTEQAMEGALARGGDFEIEHRIVRPDGEVRWHLARGTVLLDETGRPVRVLGVATEITEQKRAAEELARSEEMLRLAQNAARMGAWEWIVETGALSLDANMHELLRLDPAAIEPTFEAFLELVHPDDRGRMERTLARVLETGGRYDCDLRLLRPDGEIRWMTVRGTILRDEQGKPLRLIGVGIDDTERRRSEEALQRSEDLYGRVVEASLDLIVLINPNGRLVYLSPAGEGLLGYGRAEAEGDDAFELLHPDDRSALKRAMAAVLAKQSIDQLTVRARTKQDEEVLLAGTATLVDGVGDESDLILGIFHDVTEARRAEGERERLAQRLRQAEKMEAVGQLAGGIAHDFNNLLLAVRGCGELALHRLERDEDGAAADVEEMIGTADRAAGLTRQLLAFSRRQVMNTEVLDLNGVVEEIEKLLRHLIGENIELVAAWPEQPVLVKADRGQLEQVITNLAVNARDAMPGGGRLTIEVAVEDLKSFNGRGPSAAGTYALLTVSDTGAGIDPETAARIFEPFFTTKEDHGTGLGLATVHGIVTQSGGEISVYSEPGHGSTFKVYLPLTDECEAAAAVPSAAAEHGGGEAILLVEDEPTVRTIVQAMLEDHGYTILAAEGAEEAVSAVEQHNGPIALVLSDLILRGLNGRETAARVRRLRPETKVLYMSGYTDDVIVRSGALQPGTAFIQKPFSGEELNQRIRELLDRVEFTK